jgi:hypothetical protein
MPSRFAAMETRVSASVDALYGEAMQLVPRETGDFASTADIGRSEYAFTAIVDFAPHLVTQKNSHANDQSSILGDEIHVSIKLASLPSDKSLWPRQGDTIVLTERPNEADLNVRAFEFDGLGRYVCRCSRRGR